MRKHSSRSPAVRVPCASGILVGDPAIRGRMYYRDASSPAGSVWYALDDPDARVELVILQE